MALEGTADIPIEAGLLFSYLIVINGLSMAGHWLISDLLMPAVVADAFHSAYPHGCRIYP